MYCTNKEDKLCFLACTTGVRWNKAAPKHEVVQTLIQDIYSKSVTHRLWVPFPSYHCQCRIMQMIWQEWKCKSRNIFSLKKSKHQLCLQTSITLMILLTITGWKEGNIDFVFTNRITALDKLQIHQELYRRHHLQQLGVWWLAVLVFIYPVPLIKPKMKTNKLFLSHQLYTP